MRLSRRGKRRLIVLVAVAGTLVVAFVGFKQVRAVQQKRLVAEARAAGLEAHAAGELEETLKQLSYVVQHDRDDIEVILAFADARLRTPLGDGRHLNESLDYYKHAVSLMDADAQIGSDDPRRSEALHRMLDLYTTMGLRFELIHVANQLLELAPDDIEAMGAKARALFTDRLFEDAVLIVDRLIELEPDLLHWRQFKLEILNQLGQGDEAMLAQCDAWEAEHEGDGRYLLLKAGLLAHVGRMAEAREEASAAAARGANDLDVLQLMISLLDAVGERERASEVVAKARTEFPEEQWVHEATVRRHWQANEYSAALEKLASVEEEFTTLDLNLLKLKALLLTATEQYDEAEQTLQLIEGSDDDEATPEAAWAEAIRARIRLDDHSWDEVLSAMNQALVLNPRDATIHYIGGATYAQLGETGRALQLYRDAHQLDRDWIAAGVAYGELLLKTGRVNDAYGVARSLLSRATGGQPSVYLLFARTHLALRRAGGDVAISRSSTGERIEVSAILEAVFELRPEDAETAQLLIEAHVDEGRPDRALRAIEAIIDDERTTVPVLLQLVEVSRTHDLGVEEQLLERASAIGGLELDYALARARTLADKGENQAGLELIDSAIAASPELGSSSAAQRQRVEYMLRMAHPGADAALRRLAEQFPNEPLVQSFVLSQPLAWDDRELVEATIERLRPILGGVSQQVRLAEANALLRYASEDEANLARAIGLINNVLDESGESLPALMLMARASLVGDNPAPHRAIEHLVKAVNLYPHEVSLYGQLIHLLQADGDFERAERYLFRLSELTDGRPDLRRTELQLLQAQGDHSTAMVRAAAIIDEGSPEADQLMLAAMQLRGGDHAAAEATYRRLLSTGQPSDLVLTQAADFFAMTGRFDQGVALLTQATLDGGPAAKSLLLGMYYQRHGDLTQAETHLKQAVAQDPGSAAASHHLARHYLARNDRSSARIEALRGLQLEPGHVGLRATLALAQMGLGDEGRTEALALLDEIGGENDSLAATLRLLQQVEVDDAGTMHPGLRDLEAAQQLVNDHGQFMPAWLLAISLHVEADRIDEAVNLARRAIGRLPTQPEPAEWATTLMVEARRFDEALIEAYEWRRRSLANPLEVDLMIASILLELARTSDAAQQLQEHADRIVAERQRFPDRFDLLLETLVRSGAQAEAIALMNQVGGESPRWRSTWTELSSSMNEEDAYDALSLVEANVREPSELLPLAVAWSELAKRSGRVECFDRAEQICAQAAQQPDGAIGSKLVLGTVAEARGDVEGAKRLYREVLDLDSGNALALNNLAYALAHHDSDHDAALTYIEEALRAMPEHPNVLDTYAYVLLGLDRIADAEEALLKALAQKPDDFGLRIRMAELLVQAERLEEAATMMRRLDLELADRPLVRQRYGDRLGSLEQRLERHSAAAGS